MQVVKDKAGSAGFADGTVYVWDDDGASVDVADGHAAELLRLPGFSEGKAKKAAKAEKTPVAE